MQNSRRRSFFMLEIVIAMMLVGFFSIYFLRAAIKHLHQERRALLELEYDRVCRMQMMKILENSWPQKGKGVLPISVKLPIKVTLNEREYISEEYTFDLTADESPTAFRLCLEKRGGKKRLYYFLANK